MGLGRGSSPARRGGELPVRDRPQGRSAWPAVVRLVVLWAPVAAVLSLGLWELLFAALAPWGHRDSGPPVFDALPSQLLFAATVLVGERVEMARRSTPAWSARALRTYRALSALLITLGSAALYVLAVNQPLLQ